MSVNPLWTPSGCSGIFAVPDLMHMALGTETLCFSPSGPSEPVNYFTTITSQTELLNSCPLYLSAYSVIPNFHCLRWFLFWQDVIILFILQLEYPSSNHLKCQQHISLSLGPSSLADIVWCPLKAIQIGDCLLWYGSGLYSSCLYMMASLTD